MIYKKYSFQSEAQAIGLIDALGTFEEEGKVYPSHIHTVVKLGFLPTNVADEDNPPIFSDKSSVDVLWSDKSSVDVLWSDKYSVDILWRGLELDEEENAIFPEGWAEYEVKGLSSYKHNFFGLTYEE